MALNLINIEDAARLLRTTEIDIRKKIICDAIPYVGGKTKFLGFTMDQLYPYMNGGNA